MATLFVANGYCGRLSNLAKFQQFPKLSEKRLTKAVRSCLRDDYGLEKVKVSCAASFVEGEWTGKCEIEGARYRYVVRENRLV